MIKTLSATILGLLLSASRVFAQADPYQLPTVDVRDPSSVNLDSVVTFILDVVNLAIRIAGAICLVLVIYASLSYALAYGDEARIESAKKTLLWSIIGLVVVALATFIVFFVQHTLMGTTPVI